MSEKVDVRTNILNEAGEVIGEMEFKVWLIEDERFEKPIEVSKHAKKSWFKRLMK